MAVDTVRCVVCGNPNAELNAWFRRGLCVGNCTEVWTQRLIPMYVDCGAARKERMRARANKR